MKVVRVLRKMVPVAALLVFASSIPAQLGQGDGQDRLIPATGDVTATTFWTPAARGGTGALTVSNDRDKHTILLPDVDRIPWSGATWPTKYAALAFRGGSDQSPLEKYDTIYADRAAPAGVASILPYLPKGSTVQPGLDYAGATRWEGDPRSGYNTARILLQGEQAAKKYVQTIVDIDDPSEVKVRRGGTQPTSSSSSGTQIQYAGTTYTTRHYTLKDKRDGKTYDMYYYWFEQDSQGRKPPSRLEGRFVRFPTTSVESDHARAQWWHVRPVLGSSGTWEFQGESGIRVTVGAGAPASSGSGQTTIEFAGKTYTITEIVTSSFRQVASADYYTYLPEDLPQIPGVSKEDKRNYFVLLPGASATTVPAGGRKWVHATWGAEEYQQDPSGYDGHCNGYAAAAILFREPRATRTLRLTHGQKLRLNVTKASSALPANIRSQTLPDGVTAKPVDYLPPSEGASEIRFGVADLKGLMSALAMWTYVTYDTAGARRDSDFGTRNNQDDPSTAAWRDILPHHMHRILIEYLQDRGQALVVDRSVGSAIWNSPAYAYDFQIQSHFPAGHSYFPDKRAFYRVKATLHCSGYASAGYTGPPKKKSVTLDFDLILDDQNRVVDSRWIGNSKSSHPDFFWAPIGFAPPKPVAGQRWPVNLNLIPKVLLEEIFVDPEGKSYLHKNALVPTGVQIPPRR